MFYYDWDWHLIWPYRLVFIKGLWVTLQLTGFSVVIGTVAGFVLGVLLTKREEHWRELRQIAIILVDTVRALPPLILILLFYYGLPYVSSIRSSFWVAGLAMSVNLSAFIADVLRGAIERVPYTIVEAGYAVGMSPGVTMRRIVIPEATRQILPTLALLYIDMFKLSSLASVIAVNELVHGATEISTKEYRYLEVFLTLSVIYILIVLPFSYGVRKLATTAWFESRT